MTSPQVPAVQVQDVQPTREEVCLCELLSQNAKEGKPLYLDMPANMEPATRAAIGRLILQDLRRVVGSHMS